MSPIENHRVCDVLTQTLVLRKCLKYLFYMTHVRKNTYIKEEFDVLEVGNTMGLSCETQMQSNFYEQFPGSLVSV